MPYITQDRRDDLDILLRSPNTKGELCYDLYLTDLMYIAAKGSNFDNISDAISMLERAAHEVERRVLDPYEDKKIAENGDIPLP